MKPEEINQAAIANAAMCMWEWCQDVFRSVPYHGAYHGGRHSRATAGLWYLKDKLGTAHVRLEILTLAPQLCDEHRKAAAAGYDGVFDWEYVPWFMSNRVDYSLETGSLCLLDGPCAPPEGYRESSDPQIPEGLGELCEAHTRGIYYADPDDSTPWQPFEDYGSDWIEENIEQDASSWQRAILCWLLDNGFEPPADDPHITKTVQLYREDRDLQEETDGR